MRSMMRIVDVKAVLTKQDVSALSASQLQEGELVLHDGTGENPEGVYWFDEPNTQLVKVSTSDTGSSVTISL